jgi:hypothetical protein
MYLEVFIMPNSVEGTKCQFPSYGFVREDSVNLPFHDLFEFLVGDLYRGEFVQVGNAIRRVTHRPLLPSELQAAATKLRALLAAKLFNPPSRKQLAPNSVSQPALRFLIQTGEVAEINAEVVVAAESLNHTTELIRQYIQEDGPATVSELHSKS